MPWTLGQKGYKPGGRAPETQFKKGAMPHNHVPMSTKKTRILCAPKTLGDAELLDWLQSKLRQGQSVLIERLEDENSHELEFQIWMGKKEHGSPWVAGAPDFREMLSTAARRLPGRRVLR